MPEVEKQKNNKKHAVQSPDSYFTDVKCPGCDKITVVFKHIVIECYVSNVPL